MAHSGGVDDRWESLFADAEAQFESLRRGEVEAEAADRSRREFALVRFVDRLRGAVGVAVEVWLDAEPGWAGEPARGVLVRVGPDWLLLGGEGRREVLVPLAAVSAIAGLPGRTALPGAGGKVEAKLDLRYALRRLARDRIPVRVALRGGRATWGTFDRVGRDFVELAEHLPGEARRAAAVRSIRSIPLGALRAVCAG
ncbi:hypothetical protein CryarDRAFT_1060 [Cryptosporangium arvum DSM 44712]|uniref:Uncharacterized protein n=1 Tax=Cryptosporangium arvum DSM 44712 TaxID=927661 RepID=A0A010ZMU2_9ACTN|nr:hypothetical protein CryarDRAFT_1060 [Cryptosporangium arvum DSM 44712]